MSLTILIIVVVFLFFRIVIFPEIKKHRNIANQIQGNMKCQFEISAKENELLRSNAIPTDEHIKFYYKMYLKKWELDHADEWATDNVQPMNFKKWEERAKIAPDSVGGYYFIIGNTMDMFMGFPPNMSMMRYRDYHKMVEEDEKCEQKLS